MKNEIKVNLWLIDDDPINNVINKLYMNEINQRLIIETFVDPFEAVLKLKAIKNNDLANEVPNVILLDINMPGLSGWDFLEIFEIELKDYFQKTDIFILSSSIASDDLMKAKKNNHIKGYFKKPLDDESIKSL